METQDQYNEFIKKRLSNIERLLAVKQYQVNALLEITKAINNNFSTEALYKIYEYILRTQIQVNKLGLFVKDSIWTCVCAVGIEDDFEDVNLDRDLPEMQGIVEIDPKKFPKLKDFGIIIPVKHKETLIGVLMVNMLEQDDLVNKDEKIKFLQAITNIVMVAIENKKLFKKQLEQEVMKKELELGANMQMMLIPKDLPDNDFIEVAAEYLPNRNVGGDYYDFIQLNDHEYTFCISDISGKGIAAALLMANFQANIRSLVNREYPLEQLVDILNFKVNQVTKGEKFITFFIAHYNRDSRLLRYINAGHNPPLLWDKGEIKQLKDGTTILGIFETLPSLNKGEVYVDDNALLISYTDGLIDLENEDGEFFEQERLMEFTEKNADLHARKFNKRLLDELIEFKGAKDYIDDITLLSCRFK